MTTQAAYDVMHKMAMEAVGLAAQALTPNADTYAKLIEAERSMHSYLHITDPTLYRNAIYSDSLRQQVALAKAALAFVLAVQEVKDEVTGDPDTARARVAVTSIGE